MDNTYQSAMNHLRDAGQDTGGLHAGNLVSIIIDLTEETSTHFGPVLNGIRQQTYQSREVIILHRDLDLASTEAIRDEQEFVFYHVQTGTQDALCTALALSRGEFIVFQKAHDRLLRQALAVGVENLLARPDCAFAFGMASYSGSAAVELAESQRPRVVQSNFYLELLRGDFIGGTSAVMYRRSALMACGMFQQDQPPPSAYRLHLTLARRYGVHCHGVHMVDRDAAPPLSDHNLIRSARDELLALHEQRRFIADRPYALDAYRDGLQAIGNKVFLFKSRSLRNHMKARRWHSAVRDVAAMLGLMLLCFHNYPAGLVRLLKLEIVPWTTRRRNRPHDTAKTRMIPGMESIGYSALRTMQLIVQNSVPRDALIVLVVHSEAEEASLDLIRTKLLRLHCGSNNPIIQLGKLQENGAKYVVVPASSYWWVDQFHAPFHGHLKERCTVIWHDEHCEIYALPGVSTDATAPSNVLVAGYFSFEHGRATAGDLLVRDIVRGWLTDGGYRHDVAHAAPFLGGIDWQRTDPATYSHVIFACGPFRKAPGLLAFLNHFQGCRLIGLNLSMLEPLDQWNPFDILLERDSTVTARPDLTLIATDTRVPVIGLCLKEHSGDTRTAHAAIHRMVASREMATVRIDTRLDQLYGGMNSTGLRSPKEVESLLARMDVVVTTRLHGMVLSLKNGVPVVAIDPGDEKFKIETQARILDWPTVYRINQIDDMTLQRALDWCLTNEARERARQCAARARQSLSEISRTLIDHMRARP